MTPELKSISCSDIIGKHKKSKEKERAEKELGKRAVLLKGRGPSLWGSGYDPSIDEDPVAYKRVAMNRPKGCS